MTNKDKTQRNYFHEFNKGKILNNFSKKAIELTIKNIDSCVDREWVEDEKTLVDEDFDFISTMDLEGYYVIPMGDEVRFDYGDTCSGGVEIRGVFPFGVSKERFKDQLMKALNEMNDIIAEEKRRSVISWLESNRGNGAFEGHPEENMDFSELDDEDIEWYEENWIAEEGVAG